MSDIQQCVIDYLIRMADWESLLFIHIELERAGFKYVLTRSELHTLLKQMKKDGLIYYRYQYARIKN